MSKRHDRTFARQFDERLATMETKLKNLAAVIDDGHLPGDHEQALRVASLMDDVSVRLRRLSSNP